MKTQTDPKVDYAFKHVFGREQSKPALISLLDAVLQPPAGQGIASLDLLNPFNEKEALDDKLSILDIKARDQSGRQFNIEMQMVGYGGFRQRALYYWSRLHEGQLHEGDDYGVLRPTIAVCFVDTPLFSELADYHLIFELRERHNQTLFTDQMALHILELAKFNKAVEELATPLDRWLYFLRHAEELDADALPQPLNVPEVRWAMGDLVMISQSERDRELYESRLKMRCDISTAVAEAKEAGQAEGWQKGQAEGWEKGRVEGQAEGWEKGQAEGWEKGRVEGWEKGQAEGRVEVQIKRIQSLQRLLRQPISSPEQLKTLSSSDFESLAVQLEDQLNAKLAKGS